MPDMHLGPDGRVELDDPDDATPRALAIVNCELCDDEGYRNNRVCDHIDHAAQTVHGRALVRAELDKIAQRRAGA